MIVRHAALSHNPFEVLVAELIGGVQRMQTKIALLEKRVPFKFARRFRLDFRTQFSDRPPASANAKEPYTSI